jgi:arabinofuranosyltransferase
MLRHREQHRFHGCRSAGLVSGALRVARQPTRTDSWRTARFVLFALPAVAGAALAWRAAWLCDDAFISFRYIDNWNRGLGLVFNAGERVEGYSHFLWVVLLAALHRLGFDLLSLGRIVPFIAWVTLVGLLFVRVLRRPRATAPPGSSSAWLALPVAAWGLALHHDAQVYATGGLETAFFALLLTTGLLLVTGARPRFDLAAVVYALAVLVRPEGLFFSATAVAYVWWRARAWRATGRFLALWAALVVPWMAWKIVYYGTPIPNTYYAKSAALPYWSQGWQYTRLYFTVYPVLLACVAVAVAGMLAGWRARRAAQRPANAAARPLAAPADVTAGLVPLALVQVLLTVLYVTRVGGDFMFARFYVPVTPLLYLAAEEGGRHWRRPWVTLGLALLVVGGTLMAPLQRNRIFIGPKLVQGITDEPKWYPPDYLRSCRQQGELLQRMCTGTGARVLIPAGRAMVAYFGRLPYALEGTGLTDAEIAHQPITARGRPGHEKGASEEMLARRHVSLVLLWGAHRAVGLQPYEQVRFGDVYLRMVYYDAPVMNALARLGVSFVPMPAYLDQYLESAGQLTAGKLRSDFQRFDFFYFQHNDDPVRRERCLALLRAAGGTAP